MAAIEVDGETKRTVTFAARMAGVSEGEIKTPTGAARAVVRQYNSKVNDNRNGWEFWQLDHHGPRTWLSSIRTRHAEE